jgi:hypothetical protein
MAMECMFRSIFVKEFFMKKKIGFLAILVMVLMFGIVVVGCDTDTDDDGGNPLIGTWISSSEPDWYYIKFKKDGSFEWSFATYIAGTYATDGNILTLYTSGPGNYTYSIDGNILTLTNSWGETTTYTKK